MSRIAVNTSLSQIAGRNLDPTAVLSVVADHLYRTLSRRNEDPFSGFLRAACSVHSALKIFGPSRKLSLVVMASDCGSC